MNRAEEFNIIKDLIKKYINKANCGLFDTRNLAGDEMTTIYEGEYFTLDICYGWRYFEVFGTNEEEFEELKSYYEVLKEQLYE